MGRMGGWVGLVVGVGSSFKALFIEDIFLSPSYECPHGLRNVVSVPRSLVPNGDTFSLSTASPWGVFIMSPCTVPYRTVQVRYRKVQYCIVL